MKHCFAVETRNTKVFCCDGMKYVNDYYMIIAKHPNGSLMLSPPRSGPSVGAQRVLAVLCLKGQTGTRPSPTDVVVIPVGAYQL